MKSWAVQFPFVADVRDDTGCKAVEKAGLLQLLVCLVFQQENFLD